MPMSASPENDPSNLKKRLACPLCSGGRFQKRVVRLESKFGMSISYQTHLTCLQCRYVLMFDSEKASYWDYQEEV